MKKQLFSQTEKYLSDVKLKAATKFNPKIYEERIEYLENQLKSNAVKFSKELSKYNKTITERDFLPKEEPKVKVIKGKRTVQL